MRNNLTTLRKTIDTLDGLIIQALARRLSVARAIAGEKKQRRAPIRDSQRERQLRSLRRSIAQELNIDVRWLEKIFHLIIIESRKIQKRI